MAGAAIRRESRARIAQQGQVRRDAAAAKKQEWLDNSVVTRRGRRRVNNPTNGTTSTTAAVGAGVAAGAVAGAGVAAAAADASSLSTAAQGTAQNNPYDGVAEGVATVKVEPWSPGNNSKSTLDGILQSQGYTPEEIYGKGDDGKSLLDRVSAVNNLKNPNLFHPDQQLKIPMKEAPEQSQTSAAPQEASVSSSDVAAGDTATTLVRNEGDRLSTKTTVAKGEDGTTAAMVENRNHENRDGSITTGMMAEPGGKIVSHSEETQQGVETVTMGRNADGSALTVQDQVLHADGADVTITDADDNKNLMGVVAGDQLVVGNPGTTGGVASAVDLSENSNDGWFERAGRGIAEAFGYQGETSAPAAFAGASEVSVVRGSEGQTSVFTETDGQVRNIYNTAGDTDDTWIERAGEGVDNFFQSFTPDVPRSEDPNYTLTRRGYRRRN